MARKEYTGQHLIRFHRGRLFADIDAASQHMSYKDLAKAMGIKVSVTGATPITGWKYSTHSMYESNLRKVEEYFKRSPGYYNSRQVKTRGFAQPKRNGKPPVEVTTALGSDGMQLTLDYVQAVRRLDPTEQAKAQRLLKFITEDLG